MAYSADSTLYLFTSLTAGSSQIITATSRLETILKANKIPFRALDCATDEKARMLWGRRSKGKRLPGLVRYGQVVGDLDQIEEWNEYGELQEHINSTHDASIPATSSPASTGISLRPEPPPGVANQPTEILQPQRPSGPPSRASSEGRHISISEPTESEKEKARTPSTAPVENPMMMAMRQLGSEAAAKGQARKTSAGMAKDKPRAEEETTPAPASVPAQSTAVSATAQTPTPAATRLSADAAEPSEDPDMTAAKVPAQLAAEGARRTSVDKIEGQAPPTSSPLASSGESAELRDPFAKDDEPTSATTLSPSDKSNEQQTLELRKVSTLTKQPSALQNSESVDDVPHSEDAKNTEPMTESAEADKANKPDSPAVDEEVSAAKEHRGSTLEEVGNMEAKKVEEKNTIPEDPKEQDKEEDEDEEEEDDDDENDEDEDGDGKEEADKTPSSTKVDAEPEKAKPHDEEKDTTQQETTTKDPETAAKSVDD